MSWSPGTPGGGGDGCSQKKMVRLLSPLPKPLTLFMTKMCYFLYPIYDLSKLWGAFVDGPIDNDREKVACSTDPIQD